MLKRKAIDYRRRGLVDAVDIPIVKALGVAGGTALVSGVLCWPAG